MSRTRKVIKCSGSLIAVVTLCALGIWTFTPVSEEANYKLDQTKNTIQLNTVDTTPSREFIADGKPAVRKSTSADNKTDTSTSSLKNRQVAHTTTKLLTSADKPAPELTRSRHPFAKTESIRTEIPELEVAPLTLEVFKPEQPEEIISSAPKPRSADSIGTGRVEAFSIKSGDTLTRIFSRAELPISQAIKLSRQKEADTLNRLSIGKTMRIYFDENNQWETLEYDTDKLNTLIISPDNGEFLITQHEKQVEYRTFTARGTINTALGVATESAGVSPGITQNLVNIYQWEIDFARDIHAGDTFSVVYQKAYIDDEVIADGDILAASFQSSGRRIDAIRYTDSAGKTGYFQPDGSSLRRGFLRTPVRLARITSGFGKRRHPIKKVWKKHLGVDYGASNGTPILATADGVVQYSGKKGGYGNTVILRHGGVYTTLYAHMSKMGKGIRSGKSVTQGQVIGYVGRSGWATGDHLHYEFRINGQHKNPLKVELPKTQALAKKEMDTFTDQAEPLLGTLTSLRAEQLATLDATENETAL